MPNANTTLQERSTPEREAGEPQGQPTLFLVLECERPLAGGARYSLADRYAVTLGRGEARGCTPSSGPTGEAGAEIRVPDAWMSRSHARLEHALSRWFVRDLESRNGTWVNGERVERAALRDGDILELGRTLFRFREGVPTPADTPLELDLEAGAAGDGLSTLLPDVASHLRNLERIAPSPVEVLIHGESGTGKELVARGVHALSGRSGPFVAINCGALPGSLIESELFGYEKGAFSGAQHAKAGLIRSAEGGTLFLDEIGDLAPESQTALLRVLQEREVVPVGGTRPIPVDFRLIAATHRDLETRVREGAFREDLLGRVSAHVLHLPALRERREDLGVLLASLLPRIARDEPVPSISTRAARLLLAYDWPRNIRQLEKYLAVAAPFAERGTLKASHLPAEVRTESRRGAEAASGASGEVGEAGTREPADAREGPATRERAGTREGSGESSAKPLGPREQARKEELARLLREHAGNVSAVARVMQKGRTQIQRWLRRYDLDPDAYRDR